MPEPAPRIPRGEASIVGVDDFAKYPERPPNCAKYPARLREIVLSTRRPPVQIFAKYPGPIRRRSGHPPFPARCSKSARPSCASKPSFRQSSARRLPRGCRRELNRGRGFCEYCLRYWQRRQARLAMGADVAFPPPPPPLGRCAGVPGLPTIPGPARRRARRILARYFRCIHGGQVGMRFASSVFAHRWLATRRTLAFLFGESWFAVALARLGRSGSLR